MLWACFLSVTGKKTLSSVQGTSKEPSLEVPTGGQLSDRVSPAQTVPPSIPNFSVNPLSPRRAFAFEKLISNKTSSETKLFEKEGRDGAWADAMEVKLKERFLKPELLKELSIPGMSADEPIKPGEIKVPNLWNVKRLENGRYSTTNLVAFSPDEVNLGAYDEWVEEGRKRALAEFLRGNAFLPRTAW